MVEDNNLEYDINQASARIEARQRVIEKTVEDLANKIDLYTNWAWGFVITGALAFILSIVFYICTNTEEGFGLNLLGDFMSGTVASIWSLAGLFFIYIAFLGQKQQLLNQQLEIMYSQLEVKHTRLELSGQKQEMMEQNKTLKLQKFENTFFNLLTLHHQIIDGIDQIEQKKTSNGIQDGRLIRNPNGFTYENITVKGRDVFKNSYKILLSLIRHSKDVNYDEHYKSVYQSMQTDFGHYFRNLYRIIKFVDENKFIENEEENFKIQYQYTSMVRAQLSDYELLWLFYNCLNANGKEKFKPYIEKFCLFKNIPKDKIHDQKIIKLYKTSAFIKPK